MLENVLYSLTYVNEKISISEEENFFNPIIGIHHKTKQNCKTNIVLSDEKVNVFLKIRNKARVPAILIFYSILY